MENLEWLSHNRQHSQVRLNFVIQKTNYRDLPAFVDLCKRFNFDGCIMKLDDWGTWNDKPVATPDNWTIQNGTFLDHDICNAEHPNHKDFLQILKTERDKNLSFLHWGSFFNKFK